MIPYFSDAHLTVYQGDAATVLATLPAESVHMVCTSPPYWGLRDYGTATWDGGDEACDHSIERREGPKQTQGAQSGHASAADRLGRRECRCGARRIDGQLGLEATPEEYVAAMVGVFREVRRVLRADGTVWINLGDSYAGGGYSNHEGTGGAQRSDGGKQKHTGSTTLGLKPKDLVGIPWRVAFALQADGWYLRSEIIWSKPNPMPESVTDRPTKSHEYLFLLSKSPRYFYDADAVREAHGDGNDSRARALDRHGAIRPPLPVAGAALVGDPHIGQSDFRGLPGVGTTFGTYNPAGRNLRSVWSIATEPYPKAHFATFPQKLVEPCVKAGTSERGVCPECGAPWVRVVELTPEYAALLDSGKAWRTNEGKPDAYTNRHPKDHPANVPQKNITTGWRPGCKHDADPVPSVVLDCFAGTGTTGLVAQRLGRRAVLIDLSADYLVQCLERNAQTPLGLGA